MMKTRLITISIVLIILLSACSYQNNLPTETPTNTPLATLTPSPTNTIQPSITPSPTKIIYPTPTNDPIVINQIKLFAAALATGNKEIVAGMIYYPFSVYGNNSYVNIYSSSDFLKYYDLFFDKDFINWINSKYIGFIVSYDRWFDSYRIYDESYVIKFSPAGKVTSIKNLYQDYSSIKPSVLATATPTPDPNNCWDTAMTQYEANMCAGADLQKAEDSLQSLLNELKAVMTADQIQSLINVQAEWEQTANDYCDWEGSFNGGGSIQGMVIGVCLTNEYQQRVNDLRLLLCKNNTINGECAASLRYKQNNE
jgi:uncharacterized protein YecT (DUF1311 family)